MRASGWKVKIRSDPVPGGLKHPNALPRICESRRRRPGSRPILTILPYTSQCAQASPGQLSCARCGRQDKNLIGLATSGATHCLVPGLMEGIEPRR